jgi:hypothetical protein
MNVELLTEELFKSSNSLVFYVDSLLDNLRSFLFLLIKVLLNLFFY